MSAYFTAIYELARTRTCCLCKTGRCRVAETTARRLVPDVLCQSCFEHMPTRFKLTSQQDVFRHHITAGCHPRIAMRAACVAARGESLRDISSGIAWFRRAISRPVEGEEP